MIRCITHVHTRFSKDADLTHEQVREGAARRGVGAVLLTEHQEALRPGEAEAAAARCARLSDPRVVLLPGLEVVTADRCHVLGLGLRRPVAAGPAAEVAERIREAGAVPVLAHPSRYPRGWEARLAEVGAVEVWNRHYDGRVAPCREALAALRSSGAMPTFGLDAHGTESLAGRLPEMLVDAREGDGESVLEALAEGRCRVSLAGRPFSLEPGTGLWLRLALAAAERSLRAAVRRVSRSLPVSAAARTRWGRRW